MEKENITDQNRSEAVRSEQEQVKELLRRGVVRHYFLGPETMWTQESFGVFVGGALAVLFGGLIFPKLFLYSSNSEVLKIVCWLMAAVGIALCLKGILGMMREAKKKNDPIPDQAFDEILQIDLECLMETAKSTLKENIPQLEKEEPINEMKSILVKGPRDYVHNVNLPLAWRLGSDGRLRYSNFSVMVLFFGTEKLYLYTSIFNTRNGASKFSHVYECPYLKIRSVCLEDRVVETVNQQNKSVVQNLNMLVIDAGDDEREKLAITVADYDAMKRYGGMIDVSAAEQAVMEIRNRIS
ncbi:MAG: hypothetical protein K0R19_1172 [Bacillota bacterium]|jgi:hypothetical protein|nr:hypothetical protein [Bacillota bacterium]